MTEFKSYFQKIFVIQICMYACEWAKIRKDPHFGVGKEVVVPPWCEQALCVGSTRRLSITTTGLNYPQNPITHSILKYVGWGQLGSGVMLSDPWFLFPPKPRVYYTTFLINQAGMPACTILLCQKTYRAFTNVLGTVLAGTCSRNTPFLVVWTGSKELCSR